MLKNTLTEFDPLESQGAVLGVAEKEAFDTKNALSDPKFLEFLGGYAEGSAIDTNNPEQLEAAHQSYEHAIAATSDLAQFLHESDLFKDLGISLESGPLAIKIMEHIDTMARSEPQKLAELAATLADYHELNTEVAKAEQELENIGSTDEIRASIESLEAQQADLVAVWHESDIISRQLIGLRALYEEIVHDEEGAPTENRDLRDTRDRVRDEYGVEINPAALSQAISKVGQELRSADRKLMSSRWLEDHQKEYGDRRGHVEAFIRGTIAADTGIQDLAQRIVLDQFLKAEKDPEKAAEYASKMNQADPTGILDSASFAAMVRNIGASVQKSAESAVAAEIEKSIEAIGVGNSAYAELEQTLNAYMDRERIGKKEGRIDVAAFVTSTIEDLMRKNSATAAGRAKNVLLRHLLREISGTTEPASSEAYHFDIDKMPPMTIPTAEKAAEEQRSPEAEQIIKEMELLGSEDLNTLDAVIGMIDRAGDKVGVEILESPEFFRISQKILERMSSQWQAGVKIADSAIKHFTDVIDVKLPQYVRENLIRTQQYRTLMYKELAIPENLQNRTSRLFAKLNKFPAYVRDSLAEDAAFLDTVVESLDIAGHKWDFALFASRLNQVDAYVAKPVFTSLPFTALLKEFIMGTYLLNKNEDIAKGIRRLEPVVGKQVLAQPEIAAVIEEMAGKKYGTPQKTSKRTPQAETPQSSPKQSSKVITPEVVESAPQVPSEIVLSPRNEPIDIEATPVAETPHSNGPEMEIPVTAEFKSLEDMLAEVSQPVSAAEKTPIEVPGHIPERPQKRQKPREKGVKKYNRKNGTNTKKSSKKSTPKMVPPEIPPTAEFDSLEDLMKAVK